jgi:hypothetical protein
MLSSDHIQHVLVDVFLDQILQGGIVGHRVIRHD